MVIAEALNERKDAYAKAKSLAAQIAADAVVEKKDPETTVDQLNELIVQMQGSLARARELTEDINLANNRETLTFDGQVLTLMQAIALRDQLTILHATRTTVLDSIDERLGKRSGRYGYLGSRRTKDDVKEVSLIDRDAFRKENDGLAGQRRLLDIEIQKVNWSAEL